MKNTNWILFFVSKLEKEEKKLFDEIFNLSKFNNDIKKLKIKNNHNKKLKKEKPIFGSMKGMAEYMADDFDEPLDDLKNYM